MLSVVQWRVERVEHVAELEVEGSGGVVQQEVGDSSGVEQVKGVAELEVEGNGEVVQQEVRSSSAVQWMEGVAELEVQGACFGNLTIQLASYDK